MSMAYNNKQEISITKIIFEITKYFNISDRKLKERILNHRFIYKNMRIKEDGDTIYWLKDGEE
jgi:hypothetical protein